MISFNQVIFVGNAGTEPEMKQTSEGISVCRFRLAVSTFAGKDEQGKAKEEPMWLGINCWRNLASQVEKVVSKGALVLVSGKLAIRTYTNKDDLEKTSVEVIASTVQVLEKGKQSIVDDIPDDLPHAA